MADASRATGGAPFAFDADRDVPPLIAIHAGKGPHVIVVAATARTILHPDSAEAFGLELIRRAHEARLIARG